MKKLKIVWTVIINLIVVFIAIAIVDSFSYGAANLKIIASLALLIVVSTQAGYSQQMRISAAYAVTAQVQNAKILRKLGDIESADHLDEDSKILMEQLKGAEWKFWINSVGAMIVWLIAVLSIIGSL